jgi:hypothetical protein
MEDHIERIDKVEIKSTVSVRRHIRDRGRDIGNRSEKIRDDYQKEYLVLFTPDTLLDIDAKQREGRQDKSTDVIMQDKMHVSLPPTLIEGSADPYQHPLD